MGHPNQVAGAGVACNLKAMRCPLRIQALQHQRHHDVQRVLAQCSLHGGKSLLTARACTCHTAQMRQRPLRRKPQDMSATDLQGRLQPLSGIASPQQAPACLPCLRCRRVARITERPLIPRLPRFPAPPAAPHTSGHASRCQALEAPPRPTIHPADLIYSSRTSGTCVRTVGARLGARPWPERTSCERVGCTLLSATAAATSLEQGSAVRGSYPHRGGRREDNLVVLTTSDVDGACDVGQSFQKSFPTGWQATLKVNSASF